MSSKSIRGSTVDIGKSLDAPISKESLEETKETLMLNQVSEENLIIEPTVIFESAEKRKEVKELESTFEEINKKFMKNSEAFL